MTGAVPGGPGMMTGAVPGGPGMRGAVPGGSQVTGAAPGGPVKMTGAVPAGPEMRGALPGCEMRGAVPGGMRGAVPHGLHQGRAASWSPQQAMRQSQSPPLGLVQSQSQSLQHRHNFNHCNSDQKMLKCCFVTAEQFTAANFMLHRTANFKAENMVQCSLADSVFRLPGCVQTSRLCSDFRTVFRLSDCVQTQHSKPD